MADFKFGPKLGIDMLIDAICSCLALKQPESAHIKVTRMGSLTMTKPA